MLYTFGLYLSNFNIYTNIPDGTHQAILTLHVAALIGFAIGALICPRITTSSYRRFVQRFWRYEIFLERYFFHCAAAFFLLGSLNLAERVYLVGGDVQNLLFEMRQSYLQGELTVTQRVNGWLAQGSILFCVLCGVSDALHGVRVRRLTFLLIAVAPNGLAAGGRGFLLALVIPYTLGLLYTLQQFPLHQKVYWNLAKHRIKMLLPRATAFVVSVVAVFALLGEIRAGGERDVDRSVPAALRFSVQFAGWFASTFIAVVPAMDHYEGSLDYGYGRDSFFPWVTNQAERLLTGRVIREYQKNEIIIALRAKNPDAGVVPPSVIPYFVWDIGRERWPIFAMLFCLACYLNTSLFRPSNIFVVILAINGLSSAFYSVQTPTLWAPTFFWQLIWGGILVLSLRSLVPHSEVANRLRRMMEEAKQVEQGRGQQ